MSAPLQTTPKSVPYRTLDVWRGLAALAVVAYHWNESASRTAPQMQASAVWSSLHWGSLGVEVFFVISGYCIAASAVSHLRRGEGVGGFAGARVRRIYPTYWAALALVLLLSVVLRNLVGNGGEGTLINGTLDPAMKTPAYYGANALLLQMFLGMNTLLPVAWTLCYEVAFYAIVALALWAGRASHRPGWTLPALHTLTLAVMVAQLANPHLLAFPLNMWPLFGLGVLAFDALSPRPAADRSGRWVWGAAGSALVLAFLLTLFYKTPLGTMGQPGNIVYAVGLGFTLVVLVLFRWDSLLWKYRAVRAMGYVGLFSYSLYLVHKTVLAIMHTLTERILHLPDDRFPLPLLLLSLAASLAGGWGFYCLCERPLLLSRRKGGKAAATPTAPPVREAA